MTENIDFSNFNRKFESYKICDENENTLDIKPSLLNEVFLNVGGKIYNNGLFEIYSKQKSNIFTPIIEEEFTNAKSRIVSFSRDWMNRQLCVTNYEPYHVLIFDLNFKEILHVDVDLKKFFEKEIIEHTNDVFFAEYYKEFIEEKGCLDCGKCAGYKVPPVLGGDDSIENMEIVDCEVDAELIKQIFEKIG